MANFKELKTDEEVGLEFIFPAENRYQRLQMLNELRSKEITPLSVVGLFRRKYKSKVLGMWTEELYISRKSLDRKGILEAAEIMSSRRKSLDEDKEGGLL